MFMVAPGNRRKGSLMLGILAASLSFSPAAIAQTMPDQEIFDHLNQKYNSLIKTTRDACGYYIDPTDIYQYGDTRALMVKVIRGPEGTACKNILFFLHLKVNCQTNETAFFRRVGAPNFWQTDRQIDPEVAQKICALPAQMRERSR
jgi:hypothetical protein